MRLNGRDFYDALEKGLAVVFAADLRLLRIEFTERDDDFRRRACRTNDAVLAVMRLLAAPC